MPTNMSIILWLQFIKWARSLISVPVLKNGSHDFAQTFSMILYYNWCVKNDYIVALHFFWLISEFRWCVLQRIYYNAPICSFRKLLHYFHFYFLQIVSLLLLLVCKYEDVKLLLLICPSCLIHTTFKGVNS